MYTVAARARNLELAGKLVRFLTSPENALFSFENNQQLPARISVYLSPWTAISYRLCRSALT